MPPTLNLAYSYRSVTYLPVDKYGLVDLKVPPSVFGILA